MKEIDLGNNCVKEVRYYESGKVRYEYYFLNGKLHRKDGYAMILYYESGKVYRGAYYLNGNKHQEDGPAEIYYYESGKILTEYYYLNGEFLTEDEFEQKIFSKKLSLI